MYSAFTGMQWENEQRIPWKLYHHSRQEQVESKFTRFKDFWTSSKQPRCTLRCTKKRQHPMLKISHIITAWAESAMLSLQRLVVRLPLTTETQILSHTRYTTTPTHANSDESLQYTDKKPTHMEATRSVLKLFFKNALCAFVQRVSRCDCWTFWSSFNDDVRLLFES